MRFGVLDDEPIELDRLHEVIGSMVMEGGILPQISSFSNGSDLIRRLRRDTFDLLILDWGLPDITGIDILLWINDHLEVPPAIIMLTGRSDEKAVVDALSAGASDYIQKPFRANELTARIRNVLRHHKVLTSRGSVLGLSEILAYGDIVFDTVKQVAYKGCVDVQLTPREYKLALLLFMNIDRPLSRQYLYDHLWTRDEEFSSRSLDTHIYRIRTKLGLTAENGWVLNTVYGYGYRLICQSRFIDLESISGSRPT